MGRRRNKTDNSMFRNTVTYYQYIERLMSLAVSMFEWTNLPDTIDPRYIELMLFRNGKAVWFRDEGLQTLDLETGSSKNDGFLCLACASESSFDVYGNPVGRRAYSSYNNYSKHLTNNDSVIIWNNMIRTNSVLEMTQFAQRLWELDRIIDVNAKAQKTPMLLTGTDKQQLTLKNIYEQYDGNEPVIFGDNQLDLNKIGCLKTDAPYVADRIYQLKTEIWNEALTILGISNVNYQKKERMISDEVTRNQGGVIANRWSRLEARRQACTKINEMFGLDIWCNFRNDYREMDDELMYSGSTGDGEVDSVVIDTRTRTVDPRKGGE